MSIWKKIHDAFRFRYHLGTSSKPRPLPEWTEEDEKRVSKFHKALRESKCSKCGEEVGYTGGWVMLQGRTPEGDPKFVPFCAMHTTLRVGEDL